jgi:hypothetical protein
MFGSVSVFFVPRAAALVETLFIGITNTARGGRSTSAAPPLDPYQEKVKPAPRTRNFPPPTFVGGGIR